jgi:hypothetical protein
MLTDFQYLVLFPNEMYDRGGYGSGRQDGGGPAAHPKNAIWALYCRSMLLANFCSNVVARTTESRDERESQAEALQESWNEAQAIMDALDGHVCNLHTTVAYLCRENISKWVEPKKSLGWFAKYVFFSQRTNDHHERVTEVNIICRFSVRPRLIRCSLQGLPAGNRPGPLFNRRQAKEWSASFPRPLIPN